MEKTYVFDSNAGGFDSSTLLAALMGNRGIDPNLMAMLTNASNNRDSWGGNSMWFIWVIFMWMMYGNGNGFGWGRNGIPSELNNNFGKEVLLQAISGVDTAVGQLSTSLGCDMKSLQNALCQVQGLIQSVGNQVGMTSMQVINAIQSGNCQLGNQLAQCCCDLKNAITTQGYEGQLRTLQQTNDINSNISSNSNIIAAKLDAQTQIINDKFCQLEMREMQNKIDTLRQENNQLALAASQQAQTANIVSQIRPCPSPAYVVPNPFSCGCNNYNYPFNGNCGNC